MRYKKWIKIFLLLCLLSTLGSKVGINYLVDPFNIFNTNILKKEFQPNERFVKINYLEKHKNEFNGYMFGSSRIGTTSPIDIEKYISKSKFYNLTISSGNLYDHQKHLEYFIKNKYPIETLYLQIDIENMYFFGNTNNDYLRKFHPYILNDSLIEYYKSYLTNDFPINIREKIKININDSESVVFNFKIGSWDQPSKNNEIANNCEEYIKNIPTFNIKQKRTVTYIKRNEHKEALLNIKRLTDSNNIKLIVFTTPHNKNMMDRFVIKDYLEYLYDIANIVDYYDFSGYNTITKEDCNYYEYSHYLSKIGKLIAARIFDDKSIIVPNDFGILVTKENIDLHLLNLKEQIENYDLKKAQ